ncbi:exonuclease SbcC [Propionispira arboris]|uniref:Nuclease SbcCD subunit C n=1 Tax=Propionispira arboris TaxID=84035 RepID=A0A1H6TEA4_9FIRM|nr:SMC family ATPase [Propionispira arboris]SEI77606.1 exonuclease SbcC [Propionispira arboris]
MKLLKLVFSAFGPYLGKETLDFADLQGRSFFLIHGPTGAGKTTILDTICFALYGDASGENREAKMLRSDNADIGQMTEVEFTFSLGQDLYKVWRAPEQQRPKKRGEGTTLSTADALLYKINGSEEKLLVQGYTNVTLQIEKLLGFKSNQFRQVVLLPQGEFRRLLLANSAERQEIMQTLFKTELYRQIEEHLKEKAKDIAAAKKVLDDEQNFILRELEVDSLVCLEASIASKKITLEQTGAKVEVLKALQQKAQAEDVAGRLTESKFESAAKAALEKAEQKTKIPVVEDYRKKYQAAQQAASLEDLEVQVQSLLVNVKTDEGKLRQTSERVDYLKKQLQVAEENFRKGQEDEPKRLAMDAQVLKLTAFAEQLTGLANARQAAKQKEAALAQALALQTDGEKKVLLLAEKRQKAQALVLPLTQEKAKIEGYQSELVRLENLQIKLNEAEKIDRELLIILERKQQEDLKMQQVNELYENQQLQVIRLQHLFSIGQAAILARGLKEKQPCPVCGSLSHPHAASSTELLPTENEVQAAQQQLAELDKKRQQQHLDFSKIETQYATAMNRKNDSKFVLGENPPAIGEVRQQITLYESYLERAKQAGTELTEVEQLLEKLQMEENVNNEQQAEWSLRCKQTDNEYQAAVAVTKEREESLPEIYRDSTVLLEAQRDAIRKQKDLKYAFEKADQEVQRFRSEYAVATATLEMVQKNLLQEQDRLAQTEQKFTMRRQNAGFSSQEEYLAAKWTEKKRQEVKEKIRIFDDKLAAVEDADQKAQAAISMLTRPDLTALEQELQQTAKDYNEAYALWQRDKEQIRQSQNKAKRLQTLEARSASIQEEYGVVGTLAAVAGGNNIHGMTFQRFVLKSLLEDVIDASNMRLKIMSRGQYTLQSTPERTRKNAAGGLEIEIFDQYTGYARSVATLSGGETFLASLSLALGLADVVQSYAGGIHLDTILVDEGFGTLDPEALDMAIKALIDLQKGGRLVGIISHVPELKERIDARLEVTKGKQGSQAAFHVG